MPAICSSWTTARPTTRRQLLAAEQGLSRITHRANRGYGAALRSAFCYALAHRYDTLVTMDCDGQHQPDRIACLLEHAADVDIVSGSRYLRDFRQDTPAPNDRRYINATITSELNERYGLNITDAFCGFKAYRVSALADLKMTEDGWGMPLEVWVQAAEARLASPRDRRAAGLPRSDPGLRRRPERPHGPALRIIVKLSILPIGRSPVPHRIATWKAVTS